jgi:hypothetical protein
MALVGDDLSYGTFELCAAGLVDGAEIAAIASRVLGRQISATQMSPDQMALGLPQGRLREGMSRMIDHYNHYGLPGGNPLVLRTILGREPRTLSDYFDEMASSDPSGRCRRLV